MDTGNRVVTGMATNFGKMHYEPVTTPAIPFFRTDQQIEDGEPEVIMMPARTFLKQFNAEGVPWWEIAKDLPQGGDTWYIAVDDNGFTMMAERDPSMISLHDCDVWQIEHPGPDTAIRGHIWTGEEIVDDDSQS